MKRTTKIVIATTALAGGAVAGTAGFAAAGGSDDDASEAPITGTALDEATDAALEHTGGEQLPALRSATRRACTRSSTHPGQRKARSMSSSTRLSTSSAAKATTSPSPGTTDPARQTTQPLDLRPWRGATVG